MRDSSSKGGFKLRDPGDFEKEESLKVFLKSDKDIALNFV